MKKTRKGFTLIEMLVVIGIIVTLMGASIAGYTSMTKTASDTKTRELVSNVTTALTAMYQREGMWPKRVLSGMSNDNKLDENAALPLAKKGYLSLDMTGDRNQLTGYDKFGVLTPDGVAFMKRRGSSASSADVEKYLLRFAVDDDGDGITVHPDGRRIRATACVWCEGSAKKGGKKNVIESWTKGQEVQ